MGNLLLIITIILLQISLPVLSTLNVSRAMDASYLKSQHPVVEELLTNKYFGDTLLVCANGHLTDNKLAVGLLFPCLLTSDIFALPIENVLLVPDYTMEVRYNFYNETKFLLQTVIIFRRSDGSLRSSL